MHVQTMGMKVRSGEQVNNYKINLNKNILIFISPPPYFLGGETRGSILGCDQLHKHLNDKTKENNCIKLEEGNYGGGPPLL